MRVTQMMLTSSNLKYISQNYERLGKIQDQLISNKKITKPSDDPVVAMKGMRYRSQVNEVEQFKRNLNEVYSWLDNTDAAFEETTQALQRIRELTNQAANDSNSPSERANIAKEIKKLNEHIVSIANTRFNGKYIFNGSDTSKPPVNMNKLEKELTELQPSSSSPEPLDNMAIIFNGQEYKFDSDDETDPNNVKWVFSRPNPNDDDPNAEDTITITKDSSGNLKQIENTAWKLNEFNVDGSNQPDPVWQQSTETLSENDFVLIDKSAVSNNNQNIEIEVLKGVFIPINSEASKVFSGEMFGTLNELVKKLEDPTTGHEEITAFLDVLDVQINNVVSERAEVGARTNRVEMIEWRLMQQEITARGIMSQNEDADFEKVVMDLKIQESIHNASLAAGARIIQKTLLDFLR